MKLQLKLFCLLFFSFIVTGNIYSSKVRGIWVPDPQYTNVLKSYKNIKEFVSQLDSLNFNAIFVVSYASNKTLYPSKVLLKNSNYKHIDYTCFLSPFMKTYNIPLKSLTGDPVKDLINEAHKHNIKVFFWFEFGFMADIKLATPENNPILAKHPDWQAIGNNGEPANYNQHDYYLNSFHPKVQKYMIDLIMESIKKYPDIDGIQGDDRLPAACINSGYDLFTIKMYKKEHNGATPPLNFNDSAWVNWRLGILNNFAEKLYKKVKAKNPDMIVSFAPNPYPWSLFNLMQEWPQWVSKGNCDVLAVQCYRNDSISYANTVKVSQDNIEMPENKKIFFTPGVLLMVNGQISDATQIEKQLETNRKLNTDGEIFFYNEGLKDEKIKKIISKFYKTKSNFPIIYP